MEFASMALTLGDGSKIWRAEFTSTKTKYAIKFVADGREYWANNFGANYDASFSVRH